MDRLRRGLSEDDAVSIGTEAMAHAMKLARSIDPEVLFVLGAVLVRQHSRALGLERVNVGLGVAALVTDALKGEGDGRE